MLSQNSFAGKAEFKITYRNKPHDEITADSFIFDKQFFNVLDDRGYTVLDIIYPEPTVDGSYEFKYEKGMPGFVRVLFNYKGESHELIGTVKVKVSDEGDHQTLTFDTTYEFQGRPYGLTGTADAKFKP
ncbi:hypothetical protein FFI16_029445 [Pseudomonas sp. KBS0710]|uniref:hypothetical protein n=1 Tax=Pseudomonas sp. KBS0710 TaxID=1179667 RepID=UPI00110EE3D8|nr:hypothetical protein [Pseudomonas sp. KBS0710]TSD80390.1 hypothetical protein FFI16_029445 [Pseudomonas sp. KBS0710]